MCGKSFDGAKGDTRGGTDCEGGRAERLAGETD